MVRPLSSLPLEEAGESRCAQGIAGVGAGNARGITADVARRHHPVTTVPTVPHTPGAAQRLSATQRCLRASLSVAPRFLYGTEQSHRLGYDAGMLEALQPKSQAEWHWGRRLLRCRPYRETWDQPAYGWWTFACECPPGANTRYYIARLKRDHPKISAALAAGKFTSVRAAAKAAGFVHDPTPLTMLHRYWRQVAPDDRLRPHSRCLPPPNAAP